MAVTIRDATVTDTRAIAEVHVASWRWAYRGLLPEDFLEGLSVDDRERMWATWFDAPEPRSAALVACGADDRILGFANVGPTRDTEAPPATGELRALYVLPDVQGSGVGRSLHSTGIDRLRAASFSRATLWVLEANDLGRRFYEKAGWVWDGSISAHQFECGNLPIVRYAREL